MSRRQILSLLIFVLTRPILCTLMSDTYFRLPKAISRMNINLRAFCFISLTCGIGAIIINKLLLFFLQPYIQDLYLKLTAGNYKGSLTLSDISYLLLALNLRFYIELMVVALLTLLFLLIKGKYYKEFFLSYLVLNVTLLLSIRSGLLNIW